MERRGKRYSSILSSKRQGNNDFKQRKEGKTMKNYKDFEKQYIGDSDIASLILAGCDNNGLSLKELHFGMDASYHAYIVEGEVEIGSHYYKVAEFESWMKIYDDEGLVKKFNARKIIVYRAAEMGCIIQTIQ